MNDFVKQFEAKVERIRSLMDEERQAHDKARANGFADYDSLKAAYDAIAAQFDTSELRKELRDFVSDNNLIVSSVYASYSGTLNLPGGIVVELFCANASVRDGYYVFGVEDSCSGEMVEIRLPISMKFEVERPTWGGCYEICVADGHGDAEVADG